MKHLLCLLALLFIGSSYQVQAGEGVGAVVDRASLVRGAQLVLVFPEGTKGPAKTFTSSGWRGRVSFISPISDRGFCSTCNRVRMTSEGRLRGCLLYPCWLRSERRTW